MNRQINNPQPGYFKVRAFRGGPWLPALIRRICMCTIGNSVEHDHTPACDRRGSLIAEIGGSEASVERVWTYGRDITPEEFHRLASGAIQTDRPLSEHPPVF